VLDEESSARLTSFALGAGSRVAVIVADGLSAEAVETNAVPVLAALLPLLASAGLAAPSVVLAEQGRVAIGDAIGEALGASIVVLLVGERPGLSAADSLGCYITWEPRVGTPDSRRNCVSNIRDGGLVASDAAREIALVATRAAELGITGVGLRADEAAPVRIVR
jgi:ethanolamine ammonia-lyase small subunit